MAAFERAFAIVVGEEGGYSAEAADPGNWTGGQVGQGMLNATKFGISAAVYPTVDIAGLTLADPKAIYRRDYWERVQGDAVPPALALLVFDAAVNNGVERAGRWLQASAGMAEDGVIGPVTLATVAVQGRNVAGLCAEFQAQRLLFMAALPTWHVFGLGWTRRLCRLPFQSLDMSAE